MAASSLNIRDYRREIPGGIRENTFYFPVIRSKNRTSGRQTFWKIYVRVFSANENPDHVTDPSGVTFSEFKQIYLDNGVIDADLRGWIKVDSGIDGGKTKVSKPTIVAAGKNIGRANATNVVCQALRDALSQYNVQIRRSADADATDLIPPMLAQKFDPAKTKLDFPVLVQRKFDGIRTVAMVRPSDPDRVVLYSRTRKEYSSLDYLREDLKPVFEYILDDGRRVYLDGELYKHGVPLQKIAGDGRREDTVVADYKYMVYDCFLPDEPDMPADERQELVEALIEGHDCVYATHVETFICNNTEEIMQRYNQFIDEGYEGLMIRTRTKYEYSERGYHSRHLLKMKPRHDAEYLLVGWFTATKGKASGLFMAICQTPDKKVFNVTPAMTEPDRRQLAITMAQTEENGLTKFDNMWKGQLITVHYDDTSEDGVPLRASTKMHTRVDEPPAV